MNGQTIFHAPRCSTGKLRAAIENMVDTVNERRRRALFYALCETLAEREDDDLCHRADVLFSHRRDNA